MTSATSMTTKVRNYFLIPWLMNNLSLLMSIIHYDPIDWMRGRLCLFINEVRLERLS